MLGFMIVKPTFAESHSFLNKLKKTLYILAILCLLSSCNSNKKDNSSSNNNTDDSSITESKLAAFTRISSAESNIDFNNKIEHDLSTKSNLFDYDFFYNGAGVGIEDINNDGLKDIFFCGNQVPNKLFLNKGNLVFEDISIDANINTNKQ